MLDPLVAAPRSLGVLVLATAAACAGPGSDWERVSGRTWSLVAIEGRPALAEAPVHLELEGEPRLFGHAGVNRYFATFEREPGNGLRVRRLGSTRRAGPPELQRQEDRYLELLQAVDAWRLEEGRLVLLDGERAVLTFEPG